MTMSHHHDAKPSHAATILQADTPNLSHIPKPPRPWWQRRTVSITVALLGLLAVLTFISLHVIKFETHLATGDTVLLALAPVDPRGFMQGDYMSLNYALTREILAARAQKESQDQTNDGYVIVAVDQHNVGHFVRLANSYEPDALAGHEIAIHYRLRMGSVALASNAFFFQEGQADAFEEAKYGQFRINDKGEPLLVNLVNDTFDVIEPKRYSQSNIKKAQ